MNFEDWEPLYNEIVRDFGYSIEEDEHTAIMLNDLLRPEQRLGNVEMNLREKITGKPFLILGPCISAKKLGTFLPMKLEERMSSLVTVGEGTKISMELGLVPEMFFTDLDGFPSIELAANQKGAMAFIHAHGDNAHWITEWIPRFSGNVVPTCQCRPFKGIFNWGGFTDGDRAYCTLRHFGSSSVEMLGFDFSKPCGKKKVDHSGKKKKLTWAKRIIETVDESIQS